MPEQYKKNPATISKYDGIELKTEEEKRLFEKYAALGKKITDNVRTKLGGVKTTSPEWWGLREVLTEEEVDFALRMKLRKWYTMEQLVEMQKKQFDAQQVKDITWSLSVKGLIEYDWGDHYNDDGPIPNAPTDKRYRISFFVPGSAELFNSSLDRIESRPAVANFFERMTFLPLEHVTHMVRPGGNGIGMHVIPVEKAIETNPETIKIEKISYWMKKYKGHVSAGICSCRASRAMLGEGCEDDINDWCIQLGDMADYTVETGRAHYITEEEAFETFRKAEQNGFVHQVTNIDGDDHIFDICNCDVKICNALRTALLYNTPNMQRSSFTSVVDKQKCVACGRCVEACPAGALKLGQKLCKADGTEVQYPKQPLPDKIKWGKYAWDENYRDTARVNTHDSGTAPCKTACPAHVPVQGYLKMANQGRYREALALIKRENPFPAVCGRICNKRCEDACTRGTIDSPVSIDAVKKFLAEYEIKSGKYVVPEKIVPKVNGEFDDKIAIIGAGPAGLSAAYYLGVMGYHPTVFEKNEKPGGMLRYGIPSYKLEKDVIDAEIEVIKELGVEIKCGVEVGKDITIDELKKQGYKAFYVAIGCQGGRRPGVANDTAEGTEIAVDFLRRASADKKPTLSGDVVVVGGGNVAIDCARVSSRLGAGKVSMFCLESKDTMPASKEEIFEAEDEGIAINPSYGPKEVKVDAKGHVSSIIFKRCLSTLDENGKFAPKYDEEDTIEVPANHIIFAIGQTIVWGDLLKGTKVTYWRNGYPVADKLTYQTADDDIFVGGDVNTGPRFVIDAIAQGHEVATSLARHCRWNASMTIGRDRRHFVSLNKEDILIPSYDEAGRQEAGLDPNIDHRKSFRDAHLTLTEEQVHIETNRCLSCGATIVDPNKCIGCGICTTRCEFDAIKLVRDHPKCSDMRKAENKVTGLLGYAAKRAIKIALHSGSKEAREMRARRKAWNKAHKNDPNTHTGYAVPLPERK